MIFFVFETIIRFIRYSCQRDVAIWLFGQVTRSQHVKAPLNFRIIGKFLVVKCNIDILISFSHFIVANRMSEIYPGLPFKWSRDISTVVKKLPPLYGDLTTPNQVLLFKHIFVPESVNQMFATDKWRQQSSYTEFVCPFLIDWKRNNT